jgi:hypothetical protein
MLISITRRPFAKLADTRYMRLSMEDLISLELVTRIESDFGRERWLLNPKLTCCFSQSYEIINRP